MSGLRPLKSNIIGKTAIERVSLVEYACLLLGPGLLKMNIHIKYDINAVRVGLQTLEMSGSDAIRLTNFCIQATPSSMPSSMLMSKIWAPFSTCSLAILRAS